MSLDSQEHIHDAWQKRYRSGRAGQFKRELTARDLEDAALPVGAHILDAGCGTGLHAFQMHEMGFRVTGVDFSEHAVKQARHEAERRGHDIDFQVASLLALPLPDNHFAGCTIFGVLMHIDQFEKAASECIRVVRPGGAIVIRENNAASLENRSMRLWHRISRNRRVRTESHPFGFNMFGPDGLLSRKLDLSWFVGFMQERRCHIASVKPAGSDLLTHRKVNMFGSVVPDMINRAICTTPVGHHIVSGASLIFRKEG